MNNSNKQKKLSTTKNCSNVTNLNQRVPLANIPFPYRAPQPITVYLATTMTIKDVPNVHNALWDMV